MHQCIFFQEAREDLNGGCTPQRLFFLPSFLISAYFYYVKHITFQSFNILLFFNLFILLIYFWLRWVFVATQGLSLVAASRGYSSLRCAGFSLRSLLLLRSRGSRRTGFSSCGTWAQQLWLVGSRAQAQQLWRMGLVAPWHVGSSQTRARAHVLCNGRRILNHCATKETQSFNTLLKYSIYTIHSFSTIT